MAKEMSDLHALFDHAMFGIYYRTREQDELNRIILIQRPKR